MKKIQKHKQISGWEILLFIILVSVLFLFAIQSYRLMEELERVYYKEQMLNFCEIAKIQADMLLLIDSDYPTLPYPCDYWELD